MIFKIKPLIILVIFLPTFIFYSIFPSFSEECVQNTEIITPKMSSGGYFVDNYKKNISINITPDSNPSIELFSEFNKLWTPGSTWDSGKKINRAVLDENIQKVINVTTKRTEKEAIEAYFDDRRKQSYSIIDGLPRKG